MIILYFEVSQIYDRLVIYFLKHFSGKLEAVQDILSVNAPAALIRHYSFINFEEFGYKWKPDWINMVRDPIEKVSKNFILKKSKFGSIIIIVKHFLDFSGNILVLLY